MTKNTHPWNVRTDFPIGRMIRMVVLGNMMFIGGVPILFAVGEIFEAFTNPGIYSLRELPGQILRSYEGHIERIFDHDRLYLSTLLILGTSLSIIWYIVARLIETRRLKKRWLVIRARKEGPPEDHDDHQPGAPVTTPNKQPQYHPESQPVDRSRH